jgi:hypothetical protein
MTLAELENMLPSGFHDSALKGLAVDYERRTARLDMSISVGDPDGPHEQRDDYRGAQIELSGLVFFVMDPPDAGYDFKSPGEVWIKDGYETRSIPEFTKAIDKKLLDAIPQEAFLHSFFVNDWNSYIHVAATDCSVKWVGAAEHYRGRRQHYYPGEIIDS